MNKNKNRINNVRKAEGDVVEGGKEKIKKVKAYTDGADFNEWLDQNNLPVTITFGEEVREFNPSLITWNCDPTLYQKMYEYFVKNYSVENVPDDQSPAQQEVNNQKTGQVMPVEA